MTQIHKYWQCTNCPYRSEWEFAYKHHLQRHRMFLDCTPHVTHIVKVETLQSVIRTSSHINCTLTMRVYKCEICAFETSSGSIFSKHIRANCYNLQNLDLTQKETFSCITCNLDTKSRLYFLLHLNGKSKCVFKAMFGSTRKNLLVCPLCSRQYKNFKRLKMHMSLVHPAVYCQYGQDKIKSRFRTWPPNAFKCNQCSYAAKRKAHLQSHMLFRHTKAHNIQWYHCANCPYKAKHLSTLNSHITYRHANFEAGRPHACPHCSYEAKQKSDLNIHLLHKHTNDADVKWHKCDICQYKAKRKTDLERHALYKHAQLGDIKWYDCSQCDYKFKEKKNLTRHLACVHSGPDSKWYECLECPYRTKHKGGLNRHVYEKHTDPRDIIWMKCDHCPYQAKLKEQLKRHVILKHTQLREEEWFYCPVCPYKAALRTKLNRHYKKNHGRIEIIVPD